jgi:plasmid stabilization system protein ParE
VNHLLHPEADAEFLDELRHYAEISPGLGDRFYEEISTLLRRACAHPRRYRLFDPPVRRVLAADFPYAVLYVVKADYVWVLAVAPLKRDPDYWKHRLTD